MNKEFKQYMFAPICRKGKTVVYYPDEIFVYCSLFPTYMIGNYGTIYNKRNKTKVSQSINKNGYYNTTLLNFEGKWKTVEVHRVIMLAHDPILNPEEMEVNHIDGNKLNNIYEPNSPRNNLEWVTPSQNVQHAYDTGLADRVFTPEEIQKVCFYLESGYKNQEAILKTGLEYNSSSIAMASAIKAYAKDPTAFTWKYWDNIIKNYAIPLPKEINMHHTEEEIRNICELIMLGYNDKIVAQKMTEKYNFEFREGFITTIRAKTATKWLYIISEYTFPTLRESFEFTDEEIHQLCQIIKYKQVNIEELKLQFNFKGKSNQNIHTFLGRLKRNNIKKYNHISSLYFENIEFKNHFSENQIRAICESLEIDSNNVEKAVSNAGLIYNKSTRELVYSIRSQKRHTNISKDYNIKFRNPSSNSNNLQIVDDLEISYDFLACEIHLICQYIKEGYTYLEIIEKLNLDKNSYEVLSRFFDRLKTNTNNKYRNITIQYFR